MREIFGNNFKKGIAFLCLCTMGAGQMSFANDNDDLTVSAQTNDDLTVSAETNDELTVSAETDDDLTVSAETNDELPVSAETNGGLTVSAETFEKIKEHPEKDVKVLSRPGLTFVLIKNENPEISNTVELGQGGISTGDVVIGIVTLAVIAGLITAGGVAYTRVQSKRTKDAAKSLEEFSIKMAVDMRDRDMEIMENRRQLSEQLHEDKRVGFRTEFRKLEEEKRAKIQKANAKFSKKSKQIEEYKKTEYQWSFLQKFIFGGAVLKGGFGFLRTIYKDYHRVSDKVTQLIEDSTGEVSLFTVSPDDFDQLIQAFSAKGFKSPAKINVASE